MPIAPKTDSAVPLSHRKRLVAAIDAALSRYRFLEITVIVAHGEVKWVRSVKQQTLEEFEEEHACAACA